MMIFLFGVLNDEQRALAGFFQLIEDGYFDGEENLLFVHTGGAGALFAVDMLP